MALKEEIRDQGNWLFRHRSYLPMLLLPLVFAGLMTQRIVIQDPVYSLVYDGLCIIVSVLGFVVRIITIGQVPKRTSGRNTKKQIAKTLNETGIYSVVRHPLYLGNFLMWLGIVFFVRSIWVSLIFMLLYWIYYERIMYAEEAFLTEKFGQTYTDWADRTPPFFPRWKQWQKSKLDFSMKNVLKREYSGFFGLVVSFLFVDFFHTLIQTKELIIKTQTIYILTASFVLYIFIRTLKKHTKLFNVDGR